MQHIGIDYYISVLNNMTLYIIANKAYFLVKPYNHHVVRAIYMYSICSAYAYMENEV